MKLQELLNSVIGTGLGLALSRLLPPRAGYALSRVIADYLDRRRHTLMVRSVLANQWVVHEGRIDRAQLERISRETFRSAAYSIYEFWHYMDNPRAILEKVVFAPNMLELIENARKAAAGGSRGTILIAPHLSNFDLMARALALQGLEMQVLSYPRPPSGYRWQNDLRQFPGIQATPMSIEALRKAAETLRAGRTVVTAVDRPLPTGEDAKYRPRFFGRPAAMPVFYIRLALKHNLPITLLSGCRQGDGRYYISAGEPIHMQRRPDLVEETIINTETVLSAVADLIRRVPEQWAMFYPVWPETLSMIPA
jgi:KDO2-lipid IV(A) lauroyltransferase